MKVVLRLMKTRPQRKKSWGQMLPIDTDSAYCYNDVAIRIALLKISIQDRLSGLWRVYQRHWSAVTIASPAPQPRYLFRTRAFRLCKVPFPAIRQWNPGVQWNMSDAGFAERACAEPAWCLVPEKQLYVECCGAVHDYGQALFKALTAVSEAGAAVQIDHSTTLTHAVSLVSS